MTSIYTLTQAREDFYNLIDQVSISHRPVYIAGGSKGAVLISEEDWCTIQEALHLKCGHTMNEGD